MTWTKLGDEWPDEARDLSDAAYRTHVDALCWSNRRLLDLLIPKRDLLRFAETHEPEQAAKELVHAGWWEDLGDAWSIGVRFREWQLEAHVVRRRREASALSSRISRLHQAGDHGSCNPQRCDALKGGDTSRDLSRDVSRSWSSDGSPGTGRDPGEEVCREHRLPLPCRGCAADAKASEPGDARGAVSTYGQ